MFMFYYTGTIAGLAITWILHAVSYAGVLNKMGIDRKYALIPIAAEWKMSQIFFASMRSFYQPVLAALVFIIAGRYVGTDTLLGAIFMLAAGLVYWVFLLRLRWRISRSFGKGVVFSLFTALVPYIGLMILGYGKSAFLGGPVFAVNMLPKPVRFLLNASVFLITAAEFICLVGVVGLLSIRQNPPRALSALLAKESIEKASGITDEGEIVTREQTMGEAAAAAAVSERSRDYFYPDHSGDEKVVVMDYVISTDLESRAGMASVNIAQIKDATAAGGDMTFVMQVGGGKRIYTAGMEDGTCGRYTVQDGKIEKVMELPSDTCMSEGAVLADFIKWTKDNYPADRYMLVFWDHGGGLGGGYGVDELNKRQDGSDIMPSSELVQAVKDADVKFDLIGFDTCLMQDVDLACSLEPYADYFLASEESESGFGWNYTVGFSELAKDPGIPTEEFGRHMIASFDPYNTILKDGQEDNFSTLSLLDLTLVRPAREKLDGLFVRQKAAIAEDPANYANISIAASGAYTFTGDTQIDLIDYLERLNELDYEEAILTEQEKQEVIDALQACIVFRNKNSSNGVNGISLCFPARSLSQYGDVHKQLDTLDYQAQKSLSDDFFSIMAYQREAARGDTFLDSIVPDYTKEEWYVKGFENYDTADTFVDIPLKETEAGYQIELPEKAWKSVIDSQTIVYLRTNEGRMYLGSDHIGSSDENGHPMVAFDGTWPTVGGSLICYNSLPVRETEDGTVFSGQTQAILNGSDRVMLQIQCEPVKDPSEQPPKAYIVGYVETDNPMAIFSKGMQMLQPGDTLEFLFDFYDDEGKIVKTETYGKRVRVTSDNLVEVTDEPLGECDVQFGGMLTDVYQRVFLTELLEGHVDK
ncbi:MAG: hypothetical protein IJG52_05900 [Lachnospiraceae bacterium]|nr:hypothetical protein [Lachnospiraceae bacterium]